MKDWSEFENSIKQDQIAFKETAVSLAEGLKSATKLNYLDLEDNMLCASSMAVLVDSIRNC